MDPRMDPGLDLHSLLRRGLAADECEAHETRGRRLPCAAPVYGASDQYVTLDSFSKLRSSRVERGEFQWNFMVQGVTGDEVIGVRDQIDTLVEAQMAPFVLPVLPDVTYALAALPAPASGQDLVLVHNNTNGATGPPTLILNAAPAGQYPASVLLPAATSATPWVHNPYTQLPHGGRLTVQIREAGLQSFSDRGGARHHFEFAVTHKGTGSNPMMLEAAPASGFLWDSFIFTDPLKDVHGVTLVFRNPDVPVRFEPDCLYDIAATSDAAAAPGPFVRFTSPGHNLLMGDRIFITGFVSGAPLLDAHVNRVDGHVAAGDPAAAALAPAAAIVGNFFWLDPAVSIAGFTAPAPAALTAGTVRATVCIAKRRLRIPLRLRRVVPRLTNYKEP